MGRSSSGQAKNVARRALRAIIDREPNEKDIKRVWEYFGSACAYCEKALIKSERKGHLDHLKNDGPNHICNRVLSCGPCNGDEKREREWNEFLKSKALDAPAYQRRKTRIENWTKENTPKEFPDWRPKILDVEIKKVMDAFDASAGNLRAYRKKGGKAA